MRTMVMHCSSNLLCRKVFLKFNLLLAFEVDASWVIFKVKKESTEGKRQVPPV